MGSEGSGGESSAPRDEQLIFMSDASAEAERLMSALRSRGYNVVEVPLALLVGRVSVQKPALILCDVDAAPALDQVTSAGSTLTPSTRTSTFNRSWSLVS